MKYQKIVLKYHFSCHLTSFAATVFQLGTFGRLSYETIYECERGGEYVSKQSCVAVSSDENRRGGFVIYLSMKTVCGDLLYTQIISEYCKSTHFHHEWIIWLIE